MKGASSIGRAFGSDRKVSGSNPESPVKKGSMTKIEIRICKTHGETEFAHRINKTESRWRCVKCGNQATMKRRRKVKETLVEESGSKCVDCGFKGPPFMFDFDHRDPNEKIFQLSVKGGSYSLEKLREEAAKCDLVCSNCHRMRTHRQRCRGCEYCCSMVSVV